MSESNKPTGPYDRYPSPLSFRENSTTSGLLVARNPGSLNGAGEKNIRHFNPGDLVMGPYSLSNRMVEYYECDPNGEFLLKEFPNVPVIRHEVTFSDFYHHRDDHHD